MKQDLPTIITAVQVRDPEEPATMAMEVMAAITLLHGLLPSWEMESTTHRGLGRPPSQRIMLLKFKLKKHQTISIAIDQTTLLIVVVTHVFTA
jgi:hypothetical protein